MTERLKTAEAAPTRPVFVRTVPELQSPSDATVFYRKEGDNGYNFVGWTKDTLDTGRSKVYYHYAGNKGNKSRSPYYYWDAETSTLLQTTCSQVDVWDEHIGLPEILKHVIEKRWRSGFPLLNNSNRLKSLLSASLNKRKSQAARDPEDSDAADEVVAKRRTTRSSRSDSPTPSNNEPTIERPSPSLNDTLERTIEARQQSDEQCDKQQGSLDKRKAEQVDQKKEDVDRKAKRVNRKENQAEHEAKWDSVAHIVQRPTTFFNADTFPKSRGRMRSSPKQGN